MVATCTRSEQKRRIPGARGNTGKGSWRGVWNICTMNPVKICLSPLPLGPAPGGGGGGVVWPGRGEKRFVNGTAMLPCSPLMISQSGPNRPSRGPTIVASLRRAPEWMRRDRVDSCPAGRCPKGATVPKLVLRLWALIGDRGRQGVEP
jgi:hypothetical protein